MAQSFVVRRYKEGDEKGIVELMRLCFGRVDYDYWMKYWVWAYKVNPLGNHIWITEHNGQIIAHHAHIPVNLKVGKKIFKSYIAGDAMTHPKFQRRGVQRELGNIADSELVKAGRYFGYSFPGEIVSKHKAGGGTNYDVSKTPVLMKIFDTNEVLRKLIGSRFSLKVLSVWLNHVVSVFFRPKRSSVIEDVKITEIERFDDRINDFWEDVSRHFGAIVVRDKEYLNWRYFKRPDSNFKVLLAEKDEKILGYIVFSSKDEKGFIVDLLAYPNRLDVIQNLVLRAVEQLREEKVHRIICWMLENNPCYKVLRDNGFIPIPLKYSFRVTIQSPSHVSTEFVKNPNNWYLTLGDTDGIFLG